MATFLKSINIIIRRVFSTIRKSTQIFHSLILIPPFPFGESRGQVSEEEEEDTKYLTVFSKLRSPAGSTPRRDRAK